MPSCGREHSATSSVHFVQVKLERIIRSESYVHVQLLQNALSSVSDRMGILVLQYACTTFYEILILFVFVYLTFIILS